MFDEDVLRCCRPSLHAVQHDHVGTGLRREGNVEVSPGGSDLHEDRLLPISQFSQLCDLDLEVIRSRPIGMTASTPLIDSLRQVAVWKMEGYGNDEIAQKLDCSRRTVARKLEAIRIVWSKEEIP